jgi:hypothetical protein
MNAPSPVVERFVAQMSSNPPQESSGQPHSGQAAGQDGQHPVPVRPPPPTPEAIARLGASRSDYAASAAMVKDVLGAASPTEVDENVDQAEQEQIVRQNPPVTEAQPAVREAPIAPDFFTSTRPKKRFGRSK